MNAGSTARILDGLAVCAIAFGCAGIMRKPNGECDCGRPGTVFRNNTRICVRCAELEHAMWAEKQAVAHAQRVVKGPRVDKFNRPAVYASPFDPFLNPHRVLAQ